MEQRQSSFKGGLKTMMGMSGKSGIFEILQFSLGTFGFRRVAENQAKQ
jgi:hypothetical protein